MSKKSVDWTFNWDIRKLALLMNICCLLKICHSIDIFYQKFESLFLVGKVSKFFLLPINLSAWLKYWVVWWPRLKKNLKWYLKYIYFKKNCFLWVEYSRDELFWKWIVSQPSILGKLDSALNVSLSPVVALMKLSRSSMSEKKGY